MTEPMFWVVLPEKGVFDLKADYVLTNSLYSVKQWAYDTVASDTRALWRKN